MLSARVCQVAVFGNGCFWGTELRFWTVPGVRATAVGYAAGFTTQVCFQRGRVVVCEMSPPMRTAHG